MIIGDRLRALREQKRLSQEDVEKRTGFLCCYISQVENCDTVPAIETLEKLTRALEVPLYQLFYDGEEPPTLPKLPKRLTADDIAWGRLSQGGCWSAVIFVRRIALASTTGQCLWRWLGR